MPRTKITKAKRNRDAAKEEREEIKNERLKQFESKFEQMEQQSISSCNDLIEDFMRKTNLVKLQLTPRILQIPFMDFINLDENEINKLINVECTNISRCGNISTLGPSSSTISTTSKKSNDEEDSENLRNSNQLQLPAIPTNIGRTPGPLSSAKARALIRRSRSAAGTLNNAQKMQSLKSEHSSRSKLRTPLLQQNSSSRPKAMSADRATPYVSKIDAGVSPILRRWARPGETIISLSGSPIVMPMVPDYVTNINIPTKNGIVSLRSKRVDPTEVGKQIAQHICPETIMEIKQLQVHLNMIMSMADKTS